VLEQSLAFVKSFLAYAGRQAWTTAALVLAAAALEGSGILLVVPFLELYSGAPQSGLALRAAKILAGLGLSSPQGQLLAALAVFLTLLLLRSGVVWARDVKIIALMTGFVDHWRSRIFRALAAAPWSHVARQTRSDVEHAITNDVVRIAQGTDRVLRGTVGLIILITQLIIALMLSAKLTALVLVFIAVTAWRLVPLIGKARRMGERLTRAGRSVFAVLGQFLSGLKLAKIHNAEDAYVARFEGKLAEMRAQMLGFTREQAAAQAFFQTILGVMVCAVIPIGALVFATPVPILTAILIILARLSGPFLSLLQGVQAFSSMMPAFLSVRDLTAELGRKTDPTRTPGARAEASALAPAAGPARLELADVHFNHGDQGDGVLSGVSLAIDPGDLVVLVGPSGAGKTALGGLIVGLLTPASGSVKVDGQPLAGAALYRWRQDVAYVPQDPFLFDLSIRDNLLWARPESTEVELWQALEMAGAERFVEGLENGLDTRVGERGHSLSGGERQRICFARALLRRPRMLILDEATNAVDLDLERHLLEGLVRRHPHTTTLIITHRVGSMQGVARIVSLRNGRIVEGDRAETETQAADARRTPPTASDLS